MILELPAYLRRGNSEDTTCLGTPGYAAPEQYGGNGQTTPQTDIYCLGATFHHLTTGRNPASTPFNFPRITQCRPTLLEETPRDQRDALLGLEMIIEKCTEYESQNRYQSCAELKYDLEHLEEIGLPYRRQLKRKLIAFGSCIGMAVILGAVSLFGLIMENNTKKSGYDYYIEEAVTASVEEKIENYKKAIALNPSKEEAYIELLNVMLADGEFSSEDDMELTAVLNSQENERDKSNKGYLQENRSGYVYFSYKLGNAYYYSVKGGGDKASAVGWYKNVTDADLLALDFHGIVDSEQENGIPNKEKCQARAETLGRISSYYKNKLGKTNEAGDAEVTYADYWNDLMSLYESDIAGQDNRITELRLYNEIVYQINKSYTEFKNQAGLSQKTLEDVINEIEKKVKDMEIAANSTVQEQSLKGQIEETIEAARKNIKAAFSTSIFEQNEGGNS